LAETEVQKFLHHIINLYKQILGGKGGNFACSGGLECVEIYLMTWSLRTMNILHIY